MDAGGLMAFTFFAIVACAVVWAVRTDQHESNHLCLCGDPKKAHVSARDWDSDYGDPEHVGPHYMKPGICRKCRCRSYIPDWRMSHRQG